MKIAINQEDEKTNHHTRHHKVSFIRDRDIIDHSEFVKMIVAGYRVLSVWYWKKLLEPPIVVRAGIVKEVKEILDAKYKMKLKILTEPYYRFEDLNEPLTEDDFI